MTWPRAARARTRASTIVTVVIESVLCAWWITTLLSQHAQRQFDRLRRYDRVGLVIPNWRFFAPEPAVHDFHLLYRLRDAEGDVGQWQEAFVVEERQWRHAVWFPARRSEKAVFDVCIDLMGLGTMAPEDRAKAPAHRLIANAIRRRIRESGCADAQDFQFLLVLYTGYEESGEPEYRFVSAPVPY